MSTSGGNVSYTFTGDSSGTVAAVKKVDDAIKSSASTAQANGSKIAGSMTAAGKAADKLGTSAQKAAGALGAAGGVISKVSPAAGEAASSVAALAGSMNGLKEAGVLSAASMGAVAVAVAAGAVVYWKLKQDVDAAEAAMKKQADTATLAQTRHEDLQKVVDAASDRYRVATKQISSAGLTLEKQLEEVNRAFDENAKTIYAGVGTDEQKLATMTALYQRRNATIEQLKTATKIEEGEKRTTEAATKAKERAAAVEAEMSEALRESASVRAESEAQVGKARTGIESLAKTSASASVSMLSDIDKVRAKRDEDLAAALATYQATMQAAAQSGSLQTQATTEYETARWAIIQQTELQVRQMQDESLTLEKARDRERVKMAADNAQAILGSVQSVMDSLSALWDNEYQQRVSTIQSLEQELEEGEATLTKAQRAQLKERIKDQKKAAKDAFLANQIVQILSATAATALAVVNALATVPYPAAPFVAGAAAIAGGAQIGVIAAQKPSFHAGGVNQLYPDEYNSGGSKKLQREATLNTPATEALGQEGVDRLNRLDFQPPTTTVRIGRLEASEIARTDVRGGGYLLQTVQRYASRTGQEVGLSYRKALA